MKARLSIFSVLMAMVAMPAVAGWQYDGYYVNDGYYVDDGSRFVIGFRGGLSIARAKMKNEIGSLYTAFWVNDETGSVVSDLSYEIAGAPSGYSVAGLGNIGDLPVKTDFKKNVFVGGASIGFVMPNNTHWRAELGYDYISETEYNQTPLLEGDLHLVDGVANIVHVASTAAKSTVSTDIVSAMAFYDFFDGKDKKMNQFIPYIGFGLGYATSKTTLALADIYGDLSSDASLDDFGEKNDSTGGILKFYNPTNKDYYPSSNNIALVGAIGASYGIAEYTYLDFGARFMYLPKITWNIANKDGSQHREWFSAEKVFYTNLMIGVRFEF